MIHIVYFLLLLCCTSTNMMHGAYSETTTKPSIPSNTATFDSQQQPVSSSSNAWKCLLQVTETNWEPLPPTAKRKRTTRSLIASDDEDSTIFDQEFDDQETLISKQRPRKKRRVDVPDNSCFAITCIHCFPKKTVSSPPPK